MNEKYRVISKILNDNCAASINAYESLPSKSSKPLFVKKEDDEESVNDDDQLYPFLSVNKIHNKLIEK